MHHLEGLRHGVIGAGTGRGHGEAWPFEVELHRHMAGRRVVHQLGHDEGMNTILAVFVDGSIVVIEGGHTAPGIAQDHASACRQFTRKLKPRLADRLTRGDQGELREPIVEGKLLAIEPRFGVISFDLTADLDGQTIHVAEFKVTYSATPFAHRPEGIFDILAERIDRPCPGDDDTLHDCSFTKVSIPEMIEATEEMSKSLSWGSFALNGTEMSNSSSMAKMLSTRPRLSIPRSSKVLSIFTSEGSRTACSAIIPMTRSLIFMGVTFWDCPAWI